MKSLISRNGITVAALVAGSLITTLCSCTGNQETKGTETTADTTAIGYDMNQQVFCLNMLSNISAHFNGMDSMQERTANAVNTTLASQEVQQYIGNWQCVWGPVVKTVGGNASNTMFIARKENSDTFVVAIAGTDPKSFFDWIFEDLNAAQVMWDPEHPLAKKGYISVATATGITYLKAMKDNAGLESEISAQDFLAQKATSMGTINIWVTGHSLGGALAPAYALYLHDNMGDWAKGATVNMNCLAAAGATPGDDNFAKYYDTQMGATTMRVWNKRDLVPHGYEEDMLKEVPDLYNGTDIAKMPGDLEAGLIAIEGFVATKNYTQLQPATTVGFTSDIFTNDSSSAFIKKPDLIKSFMGQAVLQHIPAYGQYFQTFEFQQAVQNALGLPAPFFTEGAYLVPVNTN